MTKLIQNMCIASLCLSSLCMGSLAPLFAAQTQSGNLPAGNSNTNSSTGTGATNSGGGINSHEDGANSTSGAGNSNNIQPGSMGTGAGDSNTGGNQPGNKGGMGTGNSATGNSQQGNTGIGATSNSSSNTGSMGTGGANTGGSDSASSTATMATEPKDLMIQFNKSETSLNEGEKAKIDDILQTLKGNPSTLKVSIAAWSDKPYPTGKSQTLKKDDVKLAEKRIEQIAMYIEPKAKFKTVERINMAKHSNAVSKLFSTGEAKAKKGYEEAQAKDTSMESEGNILKDKGGQSRAVIVIFDTANSGKAQ